MYEFRYNMITKCTMLYQTWNYNYFKYLSIRAGKTKPKNIKFQYFDKKSNHDSWYINYFTNTDTIWSKLKR